MLFTYTVHHHFSNHCQGLNYFKTKEQIEEAASVNTYSLSYQIASTPVIKKLYKNK